MIRTHIIPCTLSRTVADLLNLASGRVYTNILVTHWRVVRKKGLWLSEKASTKLSDRCVVAPIHAHSIDAAQQGFYRACTTTRALRKVGIADAKFPYRTKKFRTTIWKNTAIIRQDTTVILSNGLAHPKIKIVLPEDMREVLRFLEVRLVYDKKACRYTWHIVAENGKHPKAPPGHNIVSVDLGEIHPAVVGNEQEAVIITCRERRHEQQGHAKRLANITKTISKKRKGSRCYKRLLHTKSRMKAKHHYVMRDIEHKISRAVVDVAVEHKAATIVIGDVRDIANGVNQGKHRNQQSSQWNHGKICQYIEYKAHAEGITVELVNERYSSQTCPKCQHRHNPRGRNYRCPSCGFQAHRDVVGQVNILSIFKHGEAGKMSPANIVKHREPYQIRSTRRCRDTGQGSNPVAREFVSREAVAL